MGIGDWGIVFNGIKKKTLWEAIILLEKNKLKFIFYKIYFFLHYDILM